MITGIGLVCLHVLDTDQARESYVDTLGFEVDVDMVQDGFNALAQQIRSLVATAGQE